MTTKLGAGTMSELLLAQGQWARRLARRLVEGDQAEDLVQEAYLAGLRRPPRTGESPRGWLATVMRHLAQNARLSGRRRRAREVHAEASGGQTASAEDTLAQVQTHRRLAALVERLPDQDRQVVVLRFFEERSSEQIAANLGIPAGTVRWRLTRILAQLRTWLDEEEEGGRSRWVAALAPLAGAVVVAPARILPVVVAGAGLLATAAILMAVLLGTRKEAPVAGVAPARAPAAVVPPPEGLRNSPAGGPGERTAVAAVADRCPAQLREGQALRAAMDHDLRRFEEPGKYFEAALADAARERAVPAQLTGLLEAADGDVMECRRAICRVTVIRHPDADATVERAALLDRPWSARLQGALERLDHQSLGGISRDPLSGALQQRYALYLYLRATPALEAADGDCPGQLRALRAENEAMALRHDRAVPPPERFARGAESNPAAQREVEARLARALGGDARLLAVDCRRDVCRLKLDKGDPDERMALSRRLSDDREWSRQMRGGFRGPDGALYYRMVEPRPIDPEAEARATTFKNLINLVVAACQRCPPLYPRSDQADAIVLLPGPGELNADGLASVPSLRVTGPSAQRSFGKCLRREITAVLARGPLPEGNTRQELKLSFRGTRPDSGSQTNH